MDHALVKIVARFWYDNTVPLSPLPLGEGWGEGSPAFQRGSAALTLPLSRREREVTHSQAISVDQQRTVVALRCLICHRERV
jgi:hypothetical protein